MCGTHHRQFPCFPRWGIGPQTVELTRGKWNDVVRKEQKFQPDRSVPFTFRPKFRLLLSEVGLETRPFENGTVNFGRTGPTGQRGPPLEVDHFFRKIFTWTEAFHLCFDRKFRQFWHNGKHPSHDRFWFYFDWSRKWREIF